MLRYIFIALLIILIDQLSKYFVLLHLDFGDVINLIPFLNLALTGNHGAAFGLLANQNGWQIWVFLAIALVVSISIIIWLKVCSVKQRKLESLSLALILGGAIGNVIDRLFRGYVVDFIDFYIKDWHWYTFNFADAAICIGATLLILDIFIIKHHKKY